MAGRTTRASELGLVAVTIEGGLIAPEQVQKIASAERNAKLAASYESPKGTNLGDEIARYFRIGQALWRDYSAISSPTVTLTAAFAHDLLTQCFGFDDLIGPIEHEQGNRRYRIAREAKQGRVPIVVAPSADDRDAFNVALSEFGDGASGTRLRRSPASLLQDWLNANPSFYWGLVFAGDRVRLMRDNDSLTRPAWIEADLGAMFRDEMFADFTVWWLLTHASRFGAADAPASDCALEEWRAEGLKRGTAAREMLRGGVETALAELGQGVIEANPELRDRLQDQGTLTSMFEELLRTVYRLIFLAVAEDRDLLHPRRSGQEARALYADSYSFSFWRERSRRRAARDKHHDAWETMKITFASLERGEELLGLPALGALFAGGATPVLTAAKISNRRFLEAMFNLGFLIKDKVTHRINWRDLKTEELGSVYESLLEIQPRLTLSGQFELDAGSKGHARKTSGSYYTPDALVETLLDSALDPVLNQAEASADTIETKVAAILDLRIIDPACGSGHFLLGAARRMADRVARLRDEDAGKAETQAALRDVIGRCIHGVDRNPMAVELAKVALWIESVSPGQPLGFLDANIRCGDALLGVFDLDVLEEGVPETAYKPLTGDDKAAAKFYLQQNKAAKKGQGQFDWAGGTGAMPPRKLAANLSNIRRMPEDTVGQVEKKREAYEAWRRDPARYATRVACDLYVAAFLLPKTEVPLNHGRNMVPTTAEVRAKLGGGQVYGSLEEAAVDSAAAARVLHWPLAFPDVMVERGGFDVVLGNPPWEVVQLGEEEYFESRAPDIAQLKAAARKRAIAELEQERPQLFLEFARDKRHFEAINEFARSSGRFDLTARGKVNTYGLFAELSLSLIKQSGRAGLILPSGIGTDATSAPFFSYLVSSRRLVSLFSFYEVRKWFAATDDRRDFYLMTVGTNQGNAIFASLLTDVAQLSDNRRTFELSPADLAQINPNTKTAPIFRARADAELTAKIYNRVPVLLDEGDSARANLWGIRIRRIFNIGVQSVLASTVNHPRGDTLPMLEGKLMNAYDHRFSTYVHGDVPTEVCLADRRPDVEIRARRHMPAIEMSGYLEKLNWNKKWLIAWRDISSSTNERTLIASVLPLGAPDLTLRIGFPVATPAECALFLANLNALPLDYVVRLKVSGAHVSDHYTEQFPILPPHAYTRDDVAFIIPRVIQLSYTSYAISPFAKDLGFEGEPFSWDERSRAQARAELDAWYALAYGLSRNDLCYILDPKDVMGADYPSETFRVLQKNEIAKYGEYRTRRLILAAYDAMISDGHQPRVEGYR